MMTTVASSVRRAVLALPGLLASGAVLAHPGHDTAPAMGFWQGLEHLLTQPDHLGMLLAALGIGVFAVRAWRRGTRPGTKAGRR
jgi:hydrogenase/urease accessory protein HupE